MQVALLAFVWAEYSPSGVMSRHPVLVLWCLGLLFSKTVTQVRSPLPCIRGGRGAGWGGAGWGGAAAAAGAKVTRHGVDRGPCGAGTWQPLQRGSACYSAAPLVAVSPPPTHTHPRSSPRQVKLSFTAASALGWCA
jgi:hypothetical protein